MHATDDSQEARKLYHYLVERMELTPEQKQVLWDELQSWFGSDPDDPLEDSQTEGSAKEQVLQLIRSMG